MTNKIFTAVSLVILMSACSGGGGGGSSVVAPRLDTPPETSIPPETSTCPQNYVLVNANSDFGITSDFCVMKYEARAMEKATQSLHAYGCDGVCATKNWALSDPASPYDATTNDLLFVPASVENGRPWRSIDVDTAKAACASLGNKYALITNAEWMTLAHSIEKTAANWDGGIVGNGSLGVGYTRNPSFNHADGPAVSSSAFCAYGNEDGTCGASGQPQNLRTHVVNGTRNEIIWDLAGNVWEFVDWTISAPLLKASYNGSNGWVEFNQLNTNIDPTSEMNPNTWMPFHSTLGSSNGLGRYRRSGNTQNIAYRGGRWDSGSASPNNGGIYSLYMDNSTVGSYSVGFRCAYHP